MRTTEQQFEGFQRAGFLKACSWTPSAGGPTIVTNVRFKSPDRLLGDLAVQAPDHTIEYPASYLPGLAENEVVTISDVMVDGVTVASKNFKVRTPPGQLLDGTLMRADIKPVA